VAIGDVSGDGKPDLAVANFFANTVSVLLGTGAGRLGLKTDFTTGDNPISVAIGDVNGDGRPDLAVANATSNTVSVLLGDGAGGFHGRTDFSTGVNPQEVVIGDVNGDGRPDLAMANIGSNTVSVLLGNGAGGFGAKTDFATGTNPVSVAIGDMNGDGRPDLAVTNSSSNAVSVLLALETTRTSLSSSPNPVVLGTPLTLTASVSVPAPGSGTPSGTVSFFDGTTLLGTSPVNSGVAGLALFAPYLGGRSFSAVYSGDVKLLGSLAPIWAELVTPAGTNGIADGAPLAFALEAMRPNPSRGERLTVEFVLPTAARARLELLDVTGRRVAEREVGSLGAGRHVVDLAERRHVAAGFYLVRLTQGTNVRLARVAVLN
jgi:hypothetical protein